jgi:hypothetical protein
VKSKPGYSEIETVFQSTIHIILAAKKGGSKEVREGGGRKEVKQYVPLQNHCL